MRELHAFLTNQAGVNKTERCSTSLPLGTVRGTAGRALSLTPPLGPCRLPPRSRDPRSRARVLQPGQRCLQNVTGQPKPLRPRLIDYRAATCSDLFFWCSVACCCFRACSTLRTDFLPAGSDTVSAQRRQARRRGSPPVFRWHRALWPARRLLSSGRVYCL